MPILSKPSSDNKILEEILKRENLLEERRQKLDSLEERLKAWETKLEKKEDELLAKLQDVAKLQRDEARQLVILMWEDKLKEDVAKLIRAATDRANEEAKIKARTILVDAMLHAATSYVAEYTISTVRVPDEEMKGRIIGKEGRNIRAFEKATGVDVDLDEEGVIRLSSFDPVRREIARVALERLMKDGRIQPIRIEEVIDQVRREIERIMVDAGEDLCHRVGVYQLPKELTALLGKFKFRFSYGQNMIAHTLEETQVGIKLAHELGADVNVVKLGCLLHDIGKIITDKEGNHVELGVELLRKHNMPKAVIDCVASHHEDVPFASVEAMIVYISDAISGARPGARFEDLGEYIKRLEDLEAIVKAYPGVKEAFAVQAGREIRVIVDPEQLDDNQTVITAQKMKEKIAQKYPNFPGSIKITLIRELRATEIVY